MSLNEAGLALVPHKAVDFIAWLHLAEGTCILHKRGLITGHWVTKHNTSE